MSYTAGEWVGGDGETAEQATPTVTAMEDGRTPTTEFYKMTREEALSCVNTVVFHEMFDLETGDMKEAYTKGKPPSPPTGTVVYEVGTGRPYKYVSGMSLRRINPGSVGMEQLRKEAAQAAAEKVRRPTVTTTSSGSVQTGVKRKREECLTTPCVTATSGRLRLVVPVPTASRRRRRGCESGERGSTPSSRTEDDDPLPSRTRTPTCTEKVLGWRTSSRPERLKSDTDSIAASDGTPLLLPLQPPLTEKVDFDMCDCISLVTSNNLNLDTRKPTLSNYDAGHPEGGGRDNDEKLRGLLDGSETLRHLCAGYRNYVANDVTASVHRLSAYACRPAEHGVYYAYRSIECKPDLARQPSHVRSRRTAPIADDDNGCYDDEATESGAGRGWRLRSSDLYRLTVFIDQYINVFSTLADFCYALSFDRRRSFRGLSNVLVVDKVWTYSSERRVFVPHYQMLSRDSYTDRFVNEIRESTGGGVRSIRFLSTPNTVLYTNRSSLSQRRATRTPIDAGVARRPNTRFGGGEVTTVYPLPLKKRRVATATSTTTSTAITNDPKVVPSLVASTSTTQATDTVTDAFVPRMNGWPRVDHRRGCSRTLETTVATRPTASTTSPSPAPGGDGEDRLRPQQRKEEPMWQAKNPTLIVFKHRVNRSEPNTLLCNILVEIHLGKETRY